MDSVLMINKSLIEVSNSPIVCLLEPFKIITNSPTLILYNI
ncbi:MAG: hypothetical protein ACTS82_00645 [Arsenophonus sp. ET-DL12-MAG3]